MTTKKIEPTSVEHPVGFIGRNVHFRLHVPKDVRDAEWAISQGIAIDYEHCIQSECVKARALALEYDAQRALEAAIRGDDFADVPFLHRVRWLKAFLTWCQGTPALQAAIAADEDPSAVSEHWNEAMRLAEEAIAALDALDRTRAGQ